MSGQREAGVRLNGQSFGQGSFGRKSTAPGNPELSAAAQEFVRSYKGELAQGTQIDFTIHGHDLQHVEIELDPGEAVVAENGAMIWKDYDIDMSMVLGDGSNDSRSFVSKAGSAIRTGIAGEGLYLTQFAHTGGSKKARLALGARTPGQIVPVKLEDIGGTLVCRRGSFLAATKGAEIDMQLQQRLLSGVFGQEGLVMQAITGKGWVFVHVGGNLIERELAPNEMIHVDSGCHVAHLPSVDMNICAASGLGVAIAGKEGFFLTSLRGPGKIWLQSMPPLPNHVVPVSAVSGAIGGAATGLGKVATEGGIELLKKMF